MMHGPINIRIYLSLVPICYSCGVWSGRGMKDGDVSTCLFYFRIYW